MEKKDFKKEQVVYLKYIGDRRHGNIGEIKEGIVKSVGSKYITISGGRWGEYKFEIDNDFRQYYTMGGADYALYLTKQQIEDENEMEEIVGLIKSCFPQYTNKQSKLSLDQLKRIKLIIEE